jgi:predicted TPR repeat methyltransferase
MSNRTTLVRLLMNQATRAEGAKDSGRAMTMYERMTLVAPDNPDGWWSLARLQLGAGMVDSARKSLSAMLEITRDDERRAAITAVMEQISQP